MKAIEEKAKAYDELKVKAQELTEDGYIDKLALLDLFPELKESADEQIRKAVIDAVETLSDSPLKVMMLAWLEKQGEQKIEWNDSDEAHAHSIINHLEDFIASHPNTTGADIQGENVAWLKSLRPQKRWKPSEEQMKALYDSIPENVMEISEREMLLNELYKDLKKL